MELPQATCQVNHFHLGDEVEKYWCKVKAEAGDYVVRVKVAQGEVSDYDIMLVKMRLR